MNSFRNRLLVLIIGLIAVTQTVTLVAVLESTRRNVEIRAAQQLTAGSSYALQLLKFRASQLATGVAVLAADFGFREAVSTGDRPTILSAASNHSRRIDADLMFLVDNEGSLIAATGRVDPNFVAAMDDFTDRALLSPDMPHFALLSGRLYQFFAAPVRAPDTIAWVVMGFAVDDALAQKIGDLVGVGVSFIVVDGVASRNVASTLEPAARSPVPPSPEPGSADSGPSRMMLRAEEFLVYEVSLEPGNQAVRLLLQKPAHEVLAPFLTVRNAMLLVSGTALLLAMIVAVVLGRGATRPIEKLVAAARRIEDGEYSEPIAVGGSEEFRKLGGTLNAMQERVAEREARIRHQAFHDELTGLPNRAMAETTLAGMLAKAGANTRVTVMVVHLGNLRELNASLGHRIGDEVLVATARRLSLACQNGDHVARLGASRYVMLLSRPHELEDAPRLAAALIDMLREPFTIGQVDVELHLTAGLCTSPEQGRAADEMMRRAEIALHDAQESSERIGSFRVGSDDEHRRRLEIMTDLRRAIENNELELAYQPKVAIATRRVTGVEALVRWTHPKLGPVSPAEFVPLCEQTGGSRQLTDWVLRAAIRQMSEWRRDNISLDVAINLSAGDIVDAGFGDVILRLLAEYRVASTSLVLEITESAMMRDPVTAAGNMELLRVAGVRFSIDDFGTGYSSLSQLRKLPVDELKIDRSFVSRAHLDADDASIVSSTIELGHNLGLKVVAEGVEEADTLLMLHELGCDYAQGFVISRPMAAGDVAAFVREAERLLGESDSTQTQLRALERLSNRG
ncbi:MAG: EAL domain-containing protein [Steroidobacteraceae bacterium]